MHVSRQAADVDGFSLIAMPVIWVLAPINVAWFSSAPAVAINPSARQWPVRGSTKAGLLSSSAEAKREVATASRTPPNAHCPGVLHKSLRTGRRHRSAGACLSFVSSKPFGAGMRTGLPQVWDLLLAV
jgi:hypothetical protein